MNKKGNNKTNKGVRKKSIANLILFLISGFTFLVYYGSLKNGFVAYDDLENVTNNILIQKLNGTNLTLYFTTPLIFMYTPFVYISFATDYLIAGLNPLMYHFTNVFLHICNTVLAFHFIRLLTKRIDLSIITTCLFALNPINVDSVAWISTRGTLLFTFFYLVSMIGYVVYNSTRQKKYFALSIAAFLFSCFSKSTAITLPVVLLIIDVYAERNINWPLIRQKIPYFVIAIAFGIIAVIFRNDSGFTHSVTRFNYFDRIFLFTYSIDFFLMKLLAPFHLSAISSYPVKTNGFLPLSYYISPLILAAIFFLIYAFVKNKLAAFCALSIFIVSLSLNLIPLLEDSHLANRYAYLPSVAFGFFMALLFAEFKTTKYRFKYSTIFLSIGIILIAIFSFETFQRTGVWKNTLTLFDDIIKKNSDNVFAYNSRGIARYEMKDLEGSIADYSKAIEIDPTYDGAYYNRAISYYETSETESALNDYNKSIELNSAFSKAFVGRGILYMDRLNNPDNAVNDFTTAIKINPEFAQAYYNRGIAYAKRNDFDHACSDWKKVQSLGYDRANNFITKFCN
jgi:tetratricopeptide (TPR) repeat protein